MGPALSSAITSCSCRREEVPVSLNVYQLGQGRLLHAAIEVYGREVSYGNPVRYDFPGIYCRATLQSGAPIFLHGETEADAAHKGRGLAAAEARGKWRMVRRQLQPF